MKRGLTARQLVKALRSDGFDEIRVAGDHHIFMHPDGRVVPVAYARASQTFPIGTLRKMVKLARWTDDDLKRHDFI